MRFSVSLQAEGDREITLDEVLELADAVAPLNGIASGFGTYTYGAQIVIEAEGPDQAVDKALAEFAQAVASTSLREWPVAYAEAISEDDDFADLDDIPS